MKSDVKIHKLKKDPKCVNKLDINTPEFSSRINELRINSEKILKKNYIKEKKRRELISYIIQNEKSF